MIEPVGKEEIRRAKQIALHAERPVLPLADHPLVRAHPAGEAGWGTPSMRIRHCPHVPPRQKGPRGRWYLTDRVKVVTPERRSAAAHGVPFPRFDGLPVRVMLIEERGSVSWMPQRSRENAHLRCASGGETK